MHVRSPLAVALAALLAAPTFASAAEQAAAQKGSSTKAAPGAPSSAPAAGGTQALTIGGWVGYESGDLDGLQLRVDGELPLQKLTPQIGLSLVGAVGYSHLSDSAPGVEVTANILKLVPAARFTLPVNPQLAFFGDAGLGLYWASVSTDVTLPPPFAGSSSTSDSSLGLMLRFAAGGTLALNPRTKLGVQLVLDPMFNEFDDTTLTILAGVTYQL